MTTHPQLLVEELLAAGVAVPVEVTNATATMEQLQTPAAWQELVGERSRISLTSTLAEALDAVEQRVFLGTLLGGSGSSLGGHSVNTVTDELREEVLAALRRDFDELIGQLSARFDDAAKGVHRACKLGIEPGMTDADVIDLRSLPVVDAWKALPPLVRQLDRIGQLRLDMGTVLGVGPQSGVGYEAACFTASGGSWDPREPARDRWLRMCETAPARLLTLDESAAVVSEMYGAEPAAAMSAR